MKIKVTADSTCDLSQELIEKYEIGIFPLSVIKADQPFIDGVEISPDDIYAHVDSGGDLCSTAAVNVSDYLERFSAYRKDYDAVIHFTISSDMSACYQNAVIASSELSEVYVLDSRNLSTGIGQLVLDAAIMAQAGNPAVNIVEELNCKKERLDVSFVLDTLEYLCKGGRCSSVAALGANLLSLKPCIEVKNGKMGVGKKYRGAIDKCLIKYIEDKLLGQSDVDYSRIFITHSGFDGKTVNAVEEAVRRCGDFKEVYITRAGCTISSHCGPGCMGILFYRT